MKQLILLTAILLISTVTFAEDASTETCADGAGTVITGAVSGRKYCKSNKRMTWWSAQAWCDALGRRLFSLDDCEYSVTGTAGCADLTGVGNSDYVWTETPNGTFSAYRILVSYGNIVTNGDCYRSNTNIALCY